MANAHSACSSVIWVWFAIKLDIRLDYIFLPLGLNVCSASPSIETISYKME